MKGLYARLPLLTRVMLSTSVAVTVLFGITGQIVLRHVEQTMSQSLQEEVEASFHSYVSLWKARTDLLSNVSQIIAGMPDVRAAFGTGDQATIRDTAGELWSKISSLRGVFLVTDPSGRVVSSLGGVTAPSLGRNLELVRAAASRFPEQSSGFYLAGQDLFHFAVTPVYVQSANGPNALINVLVAGYRVDALVAQQLKEATNSEFLFVTPAGLITSTLNPRATDRIVADLAVTGQGRRVTDGVIEYAWSETPLADLSGNPLGKVYILRSFASAQQRIASMKNNILMLWLFAMMAGLLLTYLLARRIVDPVRELDRAAAAVARQNYAIQVPVTSADEIGRLAATFNSMCASIRKAQDDLIRQERISTIGRLSSSIVHDLRNPLAAIYGGAEMLVDADLPPSHVKRLAANIYRSSQRIQGMLQDLLDVSRGKQGTTEVCRLREVAMAATDSLAAAADSQGVTLSLEIPPEIEVPLERSRMERAFVNLIGNALEAMPNGGEVRIRAEMQGGVVLVHVEDNGPGIAPEIRAKLFQPFVTAGKRNGLGLGLALSRQTVLEHSGDMWVESTPGHGARFSFRLPGAQVAHEVRV